MTGARGILAPSCFDIPKNKNVLKGEIVGINFPINEIVKCVSKVALEII